MHGSKCDLVIKQGSEEKFIPTLYVENIKGESIQNFKSLLKNSLASLPYDSLEIAEAGKNVLKINIPKKYRISHEEHFAQVTSGFLKYLSEGELPDWEVPGMITKYFTTTSALKIAKGNK